MSGTTRDLLGLALFAAALFLPGLGARDLWNPNEPAYGLAVVEMASRGDALVPTVNGRTFAEKPILYYWLALAASRPFGIDELALRLPSAATGILTVLLVYLLVFPYAGRGRARIAAVLVATQFLVFWASRSIQMDLFVLAATLGVLVPVSRVLDHGLAPRLGWTLAGIAAGLGFLGKGPVAWVAAALAVATWAASTGRLREVVRPGVLLAAAVALAVSLPWVLALLGAGRVDVLEEGLWRQNVTRFVEAWDHENPWWYYLRYFWIDFAPWSWLVPAALSLPGRTVAERRLDRLALASILPILVFFSLSDSKRSAYAIPVAAGVAVLASGVVERFLEGTLARRRRLVFVALAGGLGAVLAAGGAALATVGAARFPEAAAAARATGGIALAAGALVMGSLASPARVRARAIAGSTLAAVFLVYLAAALVALPAANPYKSARGISEAWMERVRPGERVAAYGIWPWRGSYAFYARRPVPILESPEALRAVWDGSAPASVLVEGNRLEEARRVLGAIEPGLESRIGGQDVYVFFNEIGASGQ